MVAIAGIRDTTRRAGLQARLAGSDARWTARVGRIGPLAESGPDVGKGDDVEVSRVYAQPDALGKTLRADEARGGGFADAARGSGRGSAIHNHASAGRGHQHGGDK